MLTRKNNRGTTLLVILQMWILPCHGFTYAPYGLGSSSSSSAGAWSSGVAARQSSFPAMLQPRPPKAPAAAISRETLPSLSMSDAGGEPLDPFTDEPADSDNNPFGPPGPYRDEHTAGGNRFKELLARANGEPGPPPRPKAKPRRVLPPKGAVDYDDDSQWQEQAIGSPDVPDPPLRQEMPGLDLGPELDLAGGGLPAEGEAGISGGSRFSRMMNQARQNDDRQEAGMAPRASPRSPQEVAKRAAQAATGPAPVSKEEKERAIRAAVERQQKIMSRARGIDLDDPSLEGAELARKKALSRAQAESQAGGYVPSSSAADDYLNSLKADSQRKQRETQARLQGQPLSPREEPPLSASLPVEPGADVPQEQSQPLPPGEEYQAVKPQKRTAASWSIQNKADAYMASLKGIKVDIADDNPYLKNKQSLEELPPQGLPRPPPPPPPPPVGPKMSYAEKLKLAKETKGGGAAASPAAPAAVATPLPIAASPVVPQAPPPPAPPALSDSENQAQEQATAVGAGAADVPRRLLEQEVPEGALLGEDAARAKMMKVMDLLTEHKTAGLIGEERVSELRSSLVDAREYLRAETYGSSGAGGAAASTTPPPPPGPPSPPPPPPPQQQQQQQQPPTPPTPPPQAAAPVPEAPSTPARPTTSPENVETLRRCSALLQAHVHSSLAGQDLQALVEGLASSLSIVTAQVVTGIAAGTGGGSGQGTPPPVGDQEPSPAANGGSAVPDYAAGAQSVGGVLSDMGVGKRPASFMPEEGAGADGAGDGSAGWTGGSLGDDEKAIASKALGYLLKHRGGKGYGRGRVKGAEAEAMVATLAEVTEILQDEMVEE